MIIYMLNDHKLYYKEKHFRFYFWILFLMAMLYVSDFICQTKCELTTITANLHIIISQIY